MMTKKCEACKAEIQKKHSYKYLGVTLCQDCLRKQLGSPEHKELTEQTKKEIIK